MVLNIHQKISMTFLTLMFLFLMYEQLFHTLAWLVHLVFACFEYLLDLGIEHLFETGTHETQIIVFYILMGFIAGGVYKLYRLFPRWLNQLKQKLLRQKNEAVSQWRALSMLWKMVWWSFFITAFNCWLFLT